MRTTTEWDRFIMNAETALSSLERIHINDATAETTAYIVVINNKTTEVLEHLVLSSPGHVQESINELREITGDEELDEI